MQKNAKGEIKRYQHYNLRLDYDAVERLNLPVPTSNYHNELSFLLNSLLSEYIADQETNNSRDSQH